MLPVSDITSPEILDCMIQFSTSQNARIRNLANVFLEDYCKPEEVEAARQAQMQPGTVENIPLPQD